MQAVGRLGSYISRGVYTVSGPFHPFGGAVDIIVVEQPDGSFRSSPWYVRFGKFQGVLKTREKVVSIHVNGVDVGFHMYLDHKGEAYFVKEVDGCAEVDGVPNLYSSSSGDDELPIESKSPNFDAKVSGSEDLGGEKIMGRTNSRRSRIFGLVFGRGRSTKEEMVQSEEEGFGSAVGRVDSLERAEIAANLLDLRWSSSLATKKYRKDSSSRFSNRAESARELANASCSSGKIAEGIDSQAQNDVELVLGDAVAELSCPNSQEGFLRMEETGESTSEMVMHYDSYRLDHLGEEVDEKFVSVVSEIATDYNKGFDVSFRCESWDESRVQRVQSHGQCESMLISCSGFSGLVEKCHETANSIAEEYARGVHAETTLVQNEAEAKDRQVIELEKNCKESPEVILLNSLEDGPNDIHDDSITGDRRIDELQLNLESISYRDNSFCDNDFLKHTSSPSSESSNEVQFHFSDIDDSGMRKKIRLGGQEEDAASENSNQGRSKVDSEDAEDSSQERSAVDFEDAIEKGLSSPINIAKVSRTVIDEEVRKLAESMPTMRSAIENIDCFPPNCPLSQSLDLDPKPLDLLGGCEETESLVKPESEALLQQHQPHSNGNKQILQKTGNNLLDHQVELSLCRQMLYEGMGDQAAAQAFESEKLDRHKFMSLCPMVMRDDRLVVRMAGRYFPWEAAAPIVLGLVSFGSKLVTEPKGVIMVEKKAERMLDETSGLMSPRGSWRLWPFSFKRSLSRRALQENIRTKPSADDKERLPDSVENSDKAASKSRPVKKMVRLTTPTSEQLASLNLKEGSNPLTFTFSTAMLGKQQVDARIYLWKWNTRIIISDVDGTITKSDVLGQFMPLVRMDWSQTGVAHLFSAIKENGYQLLFLSARAISQAYHTRQFLFNLKQDGKGLPDGPVVISPDGIFPSLYREVIRRAPHEFKIGCLEEIKALFPQDCNPFYAGFGNRNTDEISYLKVGIPKGKIFTINPKGEVAVNKHINTKSYTSLHALVHGMFPSTAKSEQEDYNSWNYWKLPPPDIDI
ncbi:hypothetical protein SAY86_015680 [Trapa natans]|uniref:phosphatidate phosphatase n=1 Tax=Trapa natans TaxID=22666 RepID=A0AAN7R0H9_TRANT|nr:hypothetical protein SAY86_015680 [Trapa natans]